jgi:GNAT superfamily N-acetyltransferase
MIDWVLPPRRGAAAELRRIFRAYRRKLYARHRSRWFEMPLGGDAAPSPRFDARLVFDAPERVLNFIRQLDIPGTCDPVEIRTMQERGQLFVGLEERGELVGFAKLGWGLVYVLDYRTDLELPPGDFLVIESYVVPERRNLGAGSYLILATNAEMHRRGFARRIAHVEAGNAAMLRTAARVGYRPLGSVDFVSVFGHKIFRPHPASLWARADAAMQGRGATAATAGAASPCHTHQ